MSDSEGWYRGRERVDSLGEATSRIFGYVKKRPKLRGLGMDLIAFGVRATARLRHPLVPRRVPYVVVPSTEEWAASRPDAHFTPVLASERSINPPPKSVQGIVDWEYQAITDVTIPGPFVVDIEGGHTIGEHGVVVGPDGSLLRDVSLAMGGLRSFIWKPPGELPDEHQLPAYWRLPSRHLEGNAALLTSHLGRGYFHWLFDVLPRVKLLKEAGYSLDDIDHFIVPSYFARFQVETLTAIGIPRRKIVSSLMTRHLTADHLIVPSLARQTGLVPEWACRFLREAFPPEEPTHVKIGERAYLVRKVTDHGFVSSEDELIPALKEYGFEPLATEELTFAQKAWVFQNLEAVVGPEGGGLSNIVFGRPGATVIELRVRDLPAMDYSVIANRVRMDFYDVYGDGYTRDDTEPTVQQGPVRAHHVLETLEMAGMIP